MILNYELLQYFVYKKILKRKDMDKIFEECQKLEMPVEKYLIIKEYCYESNAKLCVSCLVCHSHGNIACQ